VTQLSQVTLTVMPDYGMGPFLWINRGGEDAGGNCCDATGPCDSHPLSAALHADFTTWVTEFERAPIANPELSPSALLDWTAFHKQGLALARRLKAEVGEGFRVLYVKPMEDPHHKRCERREVHADGTLALLSPRRHHRQTAV